MKIQVIAILISLLSNIVVANNCRQIHRMTVFGDSLSCPKYSGDSFYYGTLLSQVFGAELQQIARGGATTCRRRTPLLTRPFVGVSVEDQSDLSIVWAGGNDFIYKMDWDIYKAVSWGIRGEYVNPSKLIDFARETSRYQIENVRRILRRAPAGHILVTLNMPELELTRLMKTDPLKQAAKQFKETFNFFYQEGIKEVAQQFPRHHVILVDVSRRLGQFEPPDLSLAPKPIPNPCIPDLTRCVFKDAVHPSSWVHINIGSMILRELERTLPVAICQNRESPWMSVLQLAENIEA